MRHGAEAGQAAIFAAHLLQDWYIATACSTVICTGLFSKEFKAKMCVCVGVLVSATKSATSAVHSREPRDRKDLADEFRVVPVLEGYHSVYITQTSPARCVKRKTTFVGVPCDRYRRAPAR